MYSVLQDIKNPSYSEKVVSGERYYVTRRAVDEKKGDHYAVEAFTAGNSDEKRSDDEKFLTIGRDPSLVVAQGDLKRSDSHAFRLSTRDGKLQISIDGKIVYSSSLDDMMDLSEMKDRIQPNGDVLPLWKVFTGSSFSGYRYRHQGE